MLRWLMGMKMIEKIRNEEIRARVGVANISQRTSETEMIRTCGEKDRGRWSNEKMEDGSD